MLFDVLIVLVNASVVARLSTRLFNGRSMQMLLFALLSAFLVCHFAGVKVVVVAFCERLSCLKFVAPCCVTPGLL